MTVECRTFEAGVARGGPVTLRAARPSADVRSWLRRVEIWHVPMDDRFPLKRGRDSWRLLTRADASRERVAHVADRHIPGPDGPMQLRVFTPAGGVAPRPVLLWYHGGGFIMGDLDTADPTCRALANRTGAVVVAVRYRLAPENSLHDSCADAVAALRWVAEHAEEIGGDPRRLAVGGDSAGGVIAGVTALAAARGGLGLTAQLLVYPSTDLTGTYPSHDDNAEGYLITRERLTWIRGHMARATDLADPALSPLLAPDVAGVAPMVMVTAGFDPLRDEGLATWIGWPRRVFRSVSCTTRSRFTDLSASTGR